MRLPRWLRGKPKPDEPVAPEPTPKRRKRAVSAVAVAKSRTKPQKAPAVNPFKVSEDLHPPMARPGPQMAMDDAANNDFNAWAGRAVDSIFSEGQAFLGYPLLAELAQRPEYRRISETIARHMTRKWIEFQAKGDEGTDKKKDKAKSDKIAKLEEILTNMKAREAFQKIAEQDGFFGRSHIYVDLGTTAEPEELKTSIGDGADDATKAKLKGKKGSIKALKPVEAVWCYPTNYNSTDPLADDWYNPSAWFVMGKQLHASRLLTFIGRPVPDMLKPAYSFGGLAMSQMVRPYIDNWINTRQGVSEIVQAFSQFVLATNLAESLEENGDALFDRAEVFNNLRDNRGLMMIDKDAEDFKNVAVPLGTLDKLQAQAQEQTASVAGIPIVLLLMITPSGLNASSEGEIQAFYDWVNSYQESFFRPNLTALINMIQISEFGEVDPDIHFVFAPLWGLNDLELSQKQLADAQRDAAYVEAAILDVVEVRKSIAADAESPYHGLDVDDVPEPPMGEGELDGDGPPKPGESAKPGEPAKPGKKAPEAVPVREAA